MADGCRGMERSAFSWSLPAGHIPHPAPPRATIRFVPCNFVAVPSLSGGFGSHAAGFFAGESLLQKQDPVLSCPRRSVGGRWPLSLP